MIKTNLVKVISILLISLVVMLFSTSIFAADNTGFNDLTSTISSNSSNIGNENSGNGNIGNGNTNINNTNKNNTNINSNNSSSYNNTNLPKTGIESSIPIAALVIIFGISAVYAYKKVSDYKNI